mmetsp:Transcript_4358/g.13706  ORF Transcript_4358/g.13706 Transcript_4358/m.13706 type:complete len:204 (-) Transcript_4358:102-713(-)
MPDVGTWSKGTVCPNASLASSAIFACTSWPSTSAVGSLSANPRAWASARTSSYPAPSNSILESIKFVVPFMIPRTLKMSSPAKCCWSVAMMGMPPHTAASNPSVPPPAAVAAQTSSQHAASRALFAVTTCLPFASAASMHCLAAPRPPMTSTMHWMEGSFTTSSQFAVRVVPGSSGKSRGFDRSRTAILGTETTSPNFSVRME